VEGKMCFKARPEKLSTNVNAIVLPSERQAVERKLEKCLSLISLDSEMEGIIEQFGNLAISKTKRISDSVPKTKQLQTKNSSTEIESPNSRHTEPLTTKNSSAEIETPNSPQTKPSKTKNNSTEIETPNSQIVISISDLPNTSSEIETPNSQIVISTSDHPNTSRDTKFSSIRTLVLEHTRNTLPSS